MVVEVNGYTHYNSNNNNDSLKNKYAKIYRLYRHHGYVLIEVNYEIFNNNSSLLDKTKYIQKLL